MNTVNIEVKKKTLQEVYNQVALLNNMGFPNFQKGEPINNLMREIRKSIKKQKKEEVSPSKELTWINYGTGDEKRVIQDIILDEHITNDNRTGIFSKCYSTAKYGSQNDLYEMMIWNRDNPHNKITTYRIRWYHKDEEYKKIWEDKWQNNNEFMIDKLLKNHGIKRDWTYLKPTRSKLTTKKS